MFIDVANLVENQGEMVTRIEDHINSEFTSIYMYIKEFLSTLTRLPYSRCKLKQWVGSLLIIIFDIFLLSDAVIDVERGRENLGAAEKFKKAANRKKFICIALLVVLVIIILFSKYFFFYFRCLFIHKLTLCKFFIKAYSFQQFSLIFSVILFEFGAFSSSGGTTIVKVIT